MTIRIFSKIIIVLIIFNCTINGQTSPKREFRAAWVASVYNLDWPLTRGINRQVEQQNQLIVLLDSLKTAGINAVLLQVRPNCDALYNSAYEPWSYWLTGAEGTQPNPYWDPLSFAIQQAHSRGMELHAWLNPFRVKEGVSTAIHSTHIINQQPSWILSVGAAERKILNPGLSAVRDYVKSVVLDIVSNYDIDGIHFDDYFYPYIPNEITTEDAATFAAYPRGFTNIGNWRRDNINILIEDVYNSINLIKPYIMFGVSPFGIWKSGTPPGIVGTSAYSSIYCDAIAWFQNNSVDYILPQLYWRIGGAQDYSLLLNWWADSAFANNRLFFSGQIFGDTYSNNELPSQVALNRLNNKVSGNSLFRADFIRSNRYGFLDSLKNNYNKYKSLVPALTFKNNIAPIAPLNLTALKAVTGVNLKWNSSLPASDSDTARYYIIYRSASPSISSSLSSNILTVVYGNNTEYNDLTALSGTRYFYAVSSLDSYRNESALSNETSINRIILDGQYDGITFWGEADAIANNVAGFASANAKQLYVTNDDEYIYLGAEVNASPWMSWAFILNTNDGGGPNDSWARSINYDHLNKPDFIARGHFGGYAERQVWNGSSWNGVGTGLNTSEFSESIIGNNQNGWVEIRFSRSVINEVTSDIQFYITGDQNMHGSFDACPDDNNATVWDHSTSFVSLSNYINSIPLPVELSSFTASVIGNSIKLNWQTATEVNNYGFDVERKIPDQVRNDNTNYEKIGFVNGNGNSNSPKDYSFVDDKVNAGKYSYRLKQIDNDGQFEYSKTIEVDMNGVKKFELSQNYPNPFNPATTIRFNLPEAGNVKLTLFNILGQEIVALVNEYKESGVHTINFSATDGASDLNSGIYIYKLESGSFVQTRKMILLK